jgi:hypothetical protein
VTIEERVLPDLVAAHRRTVRTLVVAQAVGATGITIGIATASLLARDISGSESLAGLARTFQVLGTAIAAYVLARMMSARGRRLGLMTGYLIGSAGAVLALVAGVVDSMLLLVGAVLLGSTSAANSGALRRDRSRRGHPQGPRPLDGGLGVDDRRRGRPQPDRAGRRVRRPELSSCAIGLVALVTIAGLGAGATTTRLGPTGRVTP